MDIENSLRYYGRKQNNKKIVCSVSYSLNNLFPYFLASVYLPESFDKKFVYKYVHTYVYGDKNSYHHRKCIPSACE